MIVLYDTREHDTPALRKRLEGLGCPFERRKLDYGDYSAYVLGPNGEEISLEHVCVIERKQSLTELSANFTQGRARFEREFERAKYHECKVHLLVENGSYEKLFAGRYRSKFNPQSFIASYLAWANRYGLQLHFCRPETTPQLIYKILYYALKEHLETKGGIMHGTSAGKTSHTV